MSAKAHIPIHHDFRVRSCLDYAHKSWNLHRSPKTAHVKTIAGFFVGRCAQLRALMLMPAQIGNVSNKLREVYSHALFDVTGGLNADGVAPEQIKQIERRSNELFAFMAEEAIRLQQDDAVWEAHVHQNLIDGLAAVELMDRDAPLTGMLQASMMSYVTTAWTIIETMSGDLWEAALNAHPSSLANLTGSSKRFKGGQINKSSPQSPKEPRGVLLDDISRYGFNVADKMGTILRSKFSFASLDGIREAYACAFDGRSAQIDTALNDKSLDALTAVRNVIVHRNAQVDAEYVKKSKFLPSIPKAEVGQHLLLDGDFVVGLLKPAISTANRLLIAVDEWLAKSGDQA